MIRIALVALAVVDTHLLLDDRWDHWVWIADLGVLGLVLLLWLLGFFPRHRTPPTDVVPDDQPQGDMAGPQVGAAWEVVDPGPLEKTYAFVVVNLAPTLIAVGVCLTGLTLLEDEAWWLQVMPLLVLSAYVVHHVIRVGVVALLVGPVLRVDPETELPHLDLVLAWLISTLASLMALFVGWTAFWVDLDMLDIGVAGSTALSSSAALYLWYVADAVPVLEIPATLEWERPRGLEPLAAVLVLAFRVVVTIPIIAGLAGALYTGWRRGVAATHDAATG